MTDNFVQLGLTGVGLVARVDPHGLAGTYSWAWWPGSGSAPDAPTVVAALPPPDTGVQPPPPPNPPPGGTPITPPPALPGFFVFAYVGGLTPGATYTAQFTASTSDGTTALAPQTFTTWLTNPPPPGGGLLTGPPTTTPPTCALPSVVGHTLAGARRTLQTGCCHKLALRVRTRVAHTRRHHVRRVVAQTPRGRSKISAGATVTLTLR